MSSSFDATSDTFVIPKSFYIRPRLMKVIDLAICLSKWRKLDRLLRQLGKNHKDVFFVEIGSNDGKMADPLYRHIIKGKWSGIMVEPVRSHYERLKNNYRNVPNIIFENIAISNCRETRMFYRIRDDLAFLPKWTRGIGSLYLNVLLKHETLLPNLRDYIIAEPVDCISFDALLTKNKVDRIDILLIDTEGYDYEIIRDIDFSRILPCILIYEHKHLSALDEAKCGKILIDEGYRLTKHHSNTLAYQRSFGE